jgi:isoleucyl-tRNA synthetase
VRRIQELRRSLDLHLAQRIEIVYRASPRLAQALQQHGDFVAGEVLADRFQSGDVPEGDGFHEFAFEDETLTLRLKAAGDRIG